MLKDLATRVLATPVIWRRLRARAAPPGSLTVLCYHTLGEAEGWTMRRVSDFRADIARLRQRLDIVSLETGLARLGDPSAPAAAVLTFDDGDRGLARHLLSCLEEDPFPVTIYVATQQIETGRAYWFDRVMNALQSPCEIDLGPLGNWRLGTETGKARWQKIGDVLETLKALPQDEREARTEAIVRQTTTAADGGPLGPMSLEALKRLAAHPSVSIGAHSHGHELLDRISPDAARESVRRSRELLRDWTGQEVAHFAYPNGNHTDALAKMVQAEGFASSVALGDRPARAGDSRFALPRVSVGRYDTPDRMIVRLAGV